MTMKFGLAPPNFAKWLDAAALRTIAVTTEDLGFDSIWFGDHVAFVRADAQKYGNAFLDAFTCLSYVAGFTERLRLGTDVIVVPYRSPVLQAKVAATLDVLSGGRLDLGVGSGHVELESAALGVLYAERGPMTDEYLKVMRLMWTEQMFSFHGRYVDVDDLCPLTHPIQQPLPMIIGGSNRVAMRRALELDAGWTPMLGSVENVAKQRAELAEMAEERGRPMPRTVIRWQLHPLAEGETRREKVHGGEIHRFRMDPSERREWVTQMIALGVDEIIVDLPAYQPRYLDWVREFAEEFLAPPGQGQRTVADSHKAPISAAE